MNFNNLITSYFGNSTTEIYKNNLTNIRKYISSKKGHLSIDIYDISLDDIVKKSKDASYLDGQELLYTEDGIKLLFPVKNLWNDIKYYISKDITELEIPFEIIKNNLSYLKHFSFLNNLILSDNIILTKEQIQNICKSTNIKHLIVNRTINYMDLYKYEGFATLNTNILYKDMLIQKKQMTPNNLLFDEMLCQKIYINVFNLNKEQIQLLYNISKNDNLKEINIETKDGSNYKIENLDENVVDVYIDSNDINDVNKFYNYFVSNDYKINNISINVRNMDYLNMDLSVYEEIEKNISLTFDYGVSINSNLEEFKGLIYSLNWYRNLISEDNLSPAEKVMFAFDIMKTFSYNESKLSKQDSRYPHKIIKTGYIVCVGYSNMLEQILKDMDGIKISDIDVNCYDYNGDYLGGHARNIVELNDNKYNIHGIYAMDATWDSFKQEGKDILGKEYTALDLYRYFLVAPEDYNLMFPNDDIPDIFMFNKKNINLVNEYIYVFYEINGLNDDKLINTINEEKVKKYLSTKRISLANFNQMLYNVRIAEGYAKEDALNEVKKVDRMNKYLIQQTSNCNQARSCFEENMKKGC